LERGGIDLSLPTTKSSLPVRTQQITPPDLTPWNHAWGASFVAIDA